MQGWSIDPVYQFSQEKGFLLLKEDLRKKHNIRLLTISLASDHQCLGDSFQQLLVENFLGYDTIIANSLIYVFQGKGYLYNMNTREIFNFVFASTLESSLHSPISWLGKIWDK
jgi:hypothetical protein